MIFVSDHYTITVKLHGLLEDDDIKSQALEDDQSQIDLLTPIPGGRRDTLRRAFCRGLSSSDEDDQEGREINHSSRRSERVEKSSPMRSFGYFRIPQDVFTGIGPKFPLGPRIIDITGEIGILTPYSQLGHTP